MVKNCIAWIKRRFDHVTVGVLFATLLIKHLLAMGYLFSSTGYTFALGVFFAHFKLIYLFSLLAVIALLVSVLFLLRGWKRTLAAVVINVVFTLCVALDFIYARAFYSLPSFIWVNLLSSAGGAVQGSIGSLLWWTDILFILDFFVWIPVFILQFIRRPRGEFPAVKSKRRGVPFLAACLSALLILGVFQGHDLATDEKDRFVSATDLTEQAVALTSVGFHVKDMVAVVFGVNEIEALNKVQEAEISEYYAWKNADSGIETAPFGQLAGKNLLFIQVESLENFVIGNCIDGQEITPNLNRMLSNSYHFTHIYEQVKGGNSSDCDLMLMTSLLPIENGPTFALYGDANFNSFPDILRKNGGYRSAYFNSEKDSTWNYEQVMSGAILFDSFCMDYPQDELYNFYPPDEVMLTETLPKLVTLSKDAGDNPYYAHLVLCSSHMPFDLPEKEWRLKLPEELEGSYMGDYLQCVAYVDFAIGQFLTQAQQVGLLENTMVVITGDHGGVHKYYPQWVDKYSTEYPWMGTGETYTVPLIVYAPEIEGKVMDVHGGHVDVMPSLLHLLGIEKSTYADTAIGRNLFFTSRDFVIQPTGRICGAVTAADEAYVKKMYYYSDLLIRGRFAAQK